MAGRGDRDAEDLLRRYLTEIGRFPLLTPEEETELSRAITDGRAADEALAAATTPTARTRGSRSGGAVTSRERAELERRIAAAHEAKRRFIQCNLRLVVSIAKRHQRAGMPLLDLIQEGNLGLIRAVEKFDAGRGCRFSTYATWWIRQAINRGVADKARTIRVPHHVLEAVRLVHRSTDRLNDTLGRAPTVAELARDVEVDEAAIVDALGLLPDAISLQSPLGRGGDEGELADLVDDADAETPFDHALASVRSDAVLTALAALPDREQRVLTLRFGLAGTAPQTLEEVGRDFRITREGIRQIEAKALTRLRHPATATGTTATATTARATTAVAATAVAATATATTVTAAAVTAAGARRPGRASAVPGRRAGLTP